MNGAPPSFPYTITDVMVIDRGNAHQDQSGEATFHFTEAGLLALVRDVVAGAYGAPWPPAAVSGSAATEQQEHADTQRLDKLESLPGFVAGMDQGKRAVRLMGAAEWHGTLRAAIDAYTDRPSGE